MHGTVNIKYARSFGGNCKIVVFGFTKTCSFGGSCCPLLTIVYLLRNGGSPPKDSNDVNIINFINVASLFVIMVWLINETPDNLIAETTVSASVE